MATYAFGPYRITDEPDFDGLFEFIGPFPLLEDPGVPGIYAMDFPFSESPPGLIDITGETGVSDTGDLDDFVLSGRPNDWPTEGEMHFRLIDTMLGTLDMSCDTGYVVRSYDLGFPEVREVSYPATLDDGTFDVTTYVGARSVSLDMVLRNTPDINALRAPTQSEAQMRDELLKFLSPSRRPIMLFSEHGDDRVRMMMLRGADAPISVSQPRFNSVSVSWRAPKGLIESVDTHVARISFNEELDAEYHIHTINRGTVPAHWQLRISGDLESPHLSIGDLHLWLNYHLEPADIITIDSRTRTVRVGDTPVGYRYLDDKSDWFRIPPGEQVIDFSHSAVPRLGYPYAVWQPDASPASAADSAWAAIETTNVTTTHLPSAATFPNLASLKANITYGDGHYAGPEFEPGNYIRIGDTSQAWYNGSIWAAGYKPYNNPSPIGAPPWIWSPAIDDETGEPVTSLVELTYREMFL